MEQKEFNQMMAAEIAGKLGDAYIVEYKDVAKGNGFVRHGITIRNSGTDSGTMPILYSENEYKEYLEGSTICECADRFIQKYEESRVNDNVAGSMRDKLLDWLFVRKNVYPALISAHENQEMLSDLLHKSFMDLAVIYVIRMKDPDGNPATVKVTPGMLKFWGVEAEEFCEAAMENLAKDGYKILGQMDVICHFVDRREPTPVESIVPGSMYVYTNGTAFYGAAGMLLKDRIRQVADSRNVFILPSSIHETLLIVDDGFFDQKYLDDMVKAVNRDAVAVTDRLSDHAYYYDYEDDEIRMCA